MWKFAWKSLWRDRLRFAITISGVGLSVLLMLVMNGLFAGASRQISQYIEMSQADLFVAQSGVRNMHMANSVLAKSVARDVAAVPGVERAEPIVYFPATLGWLDASDQVYVIGIAPDSQMGGPWKMAGGTARPAPGEAVVSDRQRGADTPGLPDTVSVGGRSFTVAGLSQETKSLASTLVFLNLSDAEAMRGPGRVNYLLLRTTPGQQPAEVARRLQERFPDLSILTRAEMADSDRVLALQMGVELLKIMALVGFMIGLAVIGLTIYVATVEQLRQYGVLKAVGAGPVHLFAGILGQSLVAALLGFGAGLLLTAMVRVAVARFVPGLEIDLDLAYLGRVFGFVMLMGWLSMLPPYWRVQRVDPADVFRP